MREGNRQQGHGQQPRQGPGLQGTQSSKGGSARTCAKPAAARHAEPDTGATTMGGTDGAKTRMLLPVVPGEFGPPGSRANLLTTPTRLAGFYFFYLAVFLAGSIRLFLRRRIRLSFINRGMPAAVLPGPATNVHLAWALPLVCASTTKSNQLCDCE